MTERIQELIKQSTTIEYGVDNGFDRVTFDKEKFAKLIVQECIKFGHDDNGWKPDYMIKEHFGVEE